MVLELERWGRGRWYAYTGIWDSGARDKGLRDVKCGVRGREILDIGKSCEVWDMTANEIQGVRT